MRQVSKKINENSSTITQYSAIYSKQNQNRVVLDEINNYPDYINLYESESSMTDCYVDPFAPNPINEKVTNMIQESQKQFQGYFKRHSKQNEAKIAPKKTPREEKSLQSSSRSSITASQCSSRVAARPENKSLTSQSQESTFRTQKSSEQHQHQQHQQKSKTPNETDSRSPSPSKNFILMQLQDNEFYCCAVHQNAKQGRAKHLRYVCSDPNCDIHILCDACVEDSLCLHENKIKVEDFLNQPILAFLERDNEEDLLIQVVQQQSILFNKVKTQAEQSKTILKNYFTTMCQELEQRTQMIYQSYEERVNSQLSCIRKQMDSIQEICNAYKSHFENLAITLLEEAVEYPDTLIFKLKQTLQEFLIGSDNPREQLYQSVQGIQSNLNSIPQLRPSSMKSTYARIVDPIRVSYEHLIEDSLIGVDSPQPSPSIVMPLAGKLQDVSMRPTPNNKGLMCLQYQDAIAIHEIESSRQGLKTTHVYSLSEKHILKTQFLKRHQLLCMVRCIDATTQLEIICPQSGQLKFQCELSRVHAHHYVPFIVETSTGRLIVNKQDGSFVVVRVQNRDKICLQQGSFTIKGIKNIKYVGSQIMDTLDHPPLANNLSDDCEVLILYHQHILSLYDVCSMVLIKQATFQQSQKIESIRVQSLEPFLIEYVADNLVKSLNLDTSINDQH